MMRNGTFVRCGTYLFLFQKNFPKMFFMALMILSKESLKQKTTPTTEGQPADADPPKDEKNHP